MGKEGYITLYRSLLDNPIFNSEPFSKGQAWVAILMLTNHKKGYTPAKNGKLIPIERGECGYSMVALAEIFKWDRRTVKRFINLLENENMVQQKIVENHSIIKVLNYDKYQYGTTNGTTNGTQTINENNENNIREREREILEKYLLNRKKAKPIENIDAYIDNIKPNSLKRLVEKAYKWQEKQNQNVISITQNDYVENSPEEEAKIREIQKRFREGMKKKR